MIRLSRKVRSNFYPICFLTMLLSFGLAVCMPELEELCEDHSDCPIGSACVDSECVEQDPLEIKTTHLDDAFVGKEYHFVLTADGGVGEMTWELNEKPDWLQLEPNEGILSGIPLETYVDGHTVKIAVYDEQESKDNNTYALKVKPCIPGNTIDCYGSFGTVCYKGIQTCIKGEFGECDIRDELSEDDKKCGSACGPCDETTGPTCMSGECKCGDNPACTDETVCCSGDCLDVQNDPNNCGDCESTCDEEDTTEQNTKSCILGKCTEVECESGAANCDKQVLGCETELNTDEDCAFCGNDCNEVFDKASGTCIAGSCEMSACQKGWGNCDDSTVNGCETQLDNDLHCSACNDDCTDQFSNATGICSQGSCSIGSCDDGWGNCDDDPSDGCETNLGTLSNCSKCGDKCPSYNNASSKCSSGKCGWSCNSGWANCNGSLSDGCEINLNTNVNNCGKCGIECDIGMYCLDGVCRPIDCIGMGGRCDPNPGPLKCCPEAPLCRECFGVYVCWDKSPCPN